MKLIGRRRTGFTITELIVVIIVVAIIAAVTAIVYNSIQLHAAQSRVESDEEALKSAMLTYKSKMGELPPEGDFTNYNTTPPDCSSWPTVTSAIEAVNAGHNLATKDPWGNCYGYEDNDCATSAASGTPTYIKSYGPDGVDGGGDDIEVQVTAGC